MRECRLPISTRVSVDICSVQCVDIYSAWCGRSLQGETFTVGQNQRQRVASLPPPGPQRSVGSMGRGVFTHRLNVISRDFNNIKTLDISQSLDEREREQ